MRPRSPVCSLRLRKSSAVFSGIPAYARITMLGIFMSTTISPGTPGEIVVDMKMPNIVMRAYAGMPEKTAEDFRNLKLHTGDLGRIDEDGYVYFLDRVKDYI